MSWGPWKKGSLCLSSVRRSNETVSGNDENSTNDLNLNKKTIHVVLFILL